MIYEGNCRLGDLFTNRREKGHAGLPTLSVTLNDGLVNREALDRKQDTTLTPEEHLLVRPGDIAYNMMRMWQGAFGLVDCEGLVSPAYVVLKPNDRIDPRYASYLLKSERFLYLLWAYSYGLTEDRLRLYYDDFAHIRVALPPLSEQREIGGIFATWDSAIATAEKLLVNSCRQKQILAKRLLRPKANWADRVFCEIFKTGSQKAAQVATNSYQISGRIPIVDQGQQLIAAYTDDDSICVEPPVIVFGDHTRTVKWVGFRFRPGADGTQFLHPVADIHPKFAYHLLANATIPNLGYSRHMRVLKRLIFSIPTDQAEQSSIAGQLDLADEVIAGVRMQIEKLKDEKRALMQQLLTGKRRVRLPSTEAASA